MSPHAAGAPAIHLSAGPAGADISPFGAELRRWTIDGCDLLWQPDPRVWDATAPLLFPVVGWTRGGVVRVGADVYPLGLHGFAHEMEFRVASAEAAFVRLVLVGTERTRARYPFDFSLTVEYRLTPARLSVALVVGNLGSGPMPYACGLHPGFRWPFDGGSAADYRVLFDVEERADVPVITRDGLFSAATRPVPLDGRSLALSPELFAREALCFLDARSRGLRFERRGGATIRIDTENFRHIALWSKPGAPFLALEAWTGHGDPEGFDGDLFAKPSMRILPPGGKARHGAGFTLHDGSDR